MISLTIERLDRISKQDADALRAIADVYHPAKRNDDMPVSTLRAAVQVGNSGAMVRVMEVGEDVTAPTTSKIIGGDGAWSVDSNGKAEARSVHLDPQGTSTIQDAQVALGDTFKRCVEATAARTGATAKVHELHPHDNPATGAPTADDIADQVFNGGGLHGSPELDADAAKLEAMAGAGAAGATLADIDPAQVFSGGAALPNVQSVTPIPPPLPIVTGQTLPLPSGAATNDSPPPPPPPAPVPSDASAGAGTTSPAPSSAEVDSTGLPWDGRIHAGTKSKVASGAWMKRRGVEASEVSRIEAQLRAAMAIPAPPPPPVQVVQEQPQSAGCAGAAAPTFPTLMTFITERVMTNRLTQEQVQAAVQTVGLESINLVMAREDLIPAIMAELRKVAP